MMHSITQHELYSNIYKYIHVEEIQHDHQISV